MGSMSKKLRKRTKLSEFDLIMYGIDTKATVDELEKNAKDLAREILDSKQRLYLVFQDLDDDPREVWQVPEVAIVCQAVIDSGFFALLGNSGQGRIIDAHMCYALANGLFVDNPAAGGITQLSPAMLREIEKTTRVAESKLRRLVSTS